MGTRTRFRMRGLFPGKRPIGSLSLSQLSIKLLRLPTLRNLHDVLMKGSKGDGLRGQGGERQLLDMTAVIYRERGLVMCV